MPLSGVYRNMGQNMFLSFNMPVESYGLTLPIKLGITFRLSRMPIDSGYRDTNMRNQKKRWVSFLKRIVRSINMLVVAWLFFYLVYWMIIYNYHQWLLEKNCSKSCAKVELISIFWMWSTNNCHNLKCDITDFTI